MSKAYIRSPAQSGNNQTSIHTAVSQCPYAGIKQVHILQYIQSKSSHIKQPKETASKYKLPWIVFPSVNHLAYKNMPADRQIDESILLLNYIAYAEIYQDISANFTKFFRYVLALCKFCYVNHVNNVSLLQTKVFIFQGILSYVLSFSSFLQNFHLIYAKITKCIHTIILAVSFYAFLKKHPSHLPRSHRQPQLQFPMKRSLRCKAIIQTPATMQP